MIDVGCRTEYTLSMTILSQSYLLSSWLFAAGGYV